jgi:hypothetical protein
MSGSRHRRIGFDSRQTEFDGKCFITGSVHAVRRRWLRDRSRSRLYHAGARVMPIRRFLRGDAAFGPDDLAAMGAAFDDALRRLGLNDRTDKMTELVARKIISIAKQGERDPVRLCEAALRAFKQDGAASD